MGLAIGKHHDRNSGGDTLAVAVLIWVVYRLGHGAR
jgi:hypothetical protein